MLRISRVGGWSLATLMLAAWARPVAAVEGDPDLATVLAEGQTHLRRGENQLALATFRHAVELSGGTSFLAWKGMANTQMWLQQYGAAVESAKQTRSLAATPEEQSAATSLLVGALLPENRDAEAAEVLRAYRATGA